MKTETINGRLVERTNAGQLTAPPCEGEQQFFARLDKLFEDDEKAKTEKLWADIAELQKGIAELQQFGKVERQFKYAGEVAEFKKNCDAIAQYAEENPDKAAAILQELGTGEQSPLTPIPLAKPSKESTKALASGIQRKLGKPSFGEGKVDVRGSSAGKRLRKAIRDYRKDGEQATGRKPKK